MEHLVSSFQYYSTIKKYYVKIIKGQIIGNNTKPSKTARLCQECVKEEDAMKMFDNVKAAINYMTTV